MRRAMDESVRGYLAGREALLRRERSLKTEDVGLVFERDARESLRALVEGVKAVFSLN